MPLYDMQCKSCSHEQEVLISGSTLRQEETGNDRKCFWVKCQSEKCKGKLRKFYVVDRFYPSALKFVDGVSQWESNDKRAKALREGKH